MVVAPEDTLDIFLQPGDFYFGAGNTRIRTVLGSCVSITLWHPQRKVGGMCHYLLPGRDPAARAAPDGRYADEAMQLFLAELRSLGTRPGEYQAKLFGGGRMFRGLSGSDRLDVSGRNVIAGRRLAEALGLRVVAENLGGDAHRQVIFDVWSGDAWVRRGPRLSAAAPNAGDAP